MESAGRGLLSSNDELLILFDILLHLVNYYQGSFAVLLILHILLVNKTFSMKL